MAENLTRKIITGHLVKGDRLTFQNITEHIENVDEEIPVKFGPETIITILNVSERQRYALHAGSALNLARMEINS